ncbi:MAG: oxaloacetate decarboxylase [Chloroflexi bacterium]|nr:oxaloacetate decarboxylase [Chloroflexota bacterium]
MPGHSTRLRALVSSGQLLVVPGAANALAARVIEDIGFEAVYVTGAGMANSFLGAPDIGLLSLPEVVAHVAAIREAVDLPLIVDADTGFGNAVNVWHTVRRLERAGADAIQLEDQTFPKRCGHFEGKSVIAAAEMVEKIHAAVDARRDPDLLIIARTDAAAIHGIDAACERGNAYRQAGADIIFVEGPRSEGEIERIARAIAAPKLLNVVEGGVTPWLPHARLQELGFAIVLYANLALLAGIRGMQDALRHLRAGGDPATRPPIATWAERQRLVRKAEFDQLGRRFAHREPPVEQ